MFKAGPLLDIQSIQAKIYWLILELIHIIDWLAQSGRIDQSFNTTLSHQD